MSSRHLVGFLTVAFLVSLAAFAYQGLFARYVADDFCTSVQVRDLGFLGAQIYWYTHWTGRFVFILLIDALDSAGEWTVPLTPPVMLVGWLAAFVAATTPAWAHLAGDRQRQPWLALLLGLIAITLTLASANALWQDLDWQTGSVTYLLPMVLMTAYAASLWRLGNAAHHRGSAAGWIGLGMLLVVLAVGCSETAMALVVSVLALGTLAAWLTVRGRGHAGMPPSLLLVGMSSALLAALIASIVVVVAPGNLVRLGYFPSPDLLRATLETAWFPFFLAARFVVLAPLYAISAYVAPYLSGRLRAPCGAPPTGGPPYRRWRRLAIAGGALIIAACMAPAFYATSFLPAERALIIPQFVLVLTIMSCGLLDGLAAPPLVAIWRSERSLRRLLLTASLAFALLVPLGTAARTVFQANDLRVFGG